MNTPTQQLIADTLALDEKATAIGIPGYRVTPQGSVISLASDWRGYGQRVMAAHPNSHGYLRVRLVINGRRKSYLVHKLVACIFHGAKPTPQHQVCHRDGNKQNNTADNIYWGTASDNAMDRQRHGHETAAINGKRSAWKTSLSMREHWKRKRALDAIEREVGK